MGQEKKERAARIKKLTEENKLLSEGMGGDLGGVKRRVPSVKPGTKSAGKSSSTSSQLNCQATGQSAFQNHLTRNQLQSSEHRPEDESLYTGLNINGIRKLPGLGEHV